MSGTVTFACSGCSATLEVPWRPTVERYYIGSGIDKVTTTMPTIRGLGIAAGWTPVDPYTWTTYCPECWEDIDGAAT